MKSFVRCGIIVACLFLKGEAGHSQGYFKWLEKPEKTYHKKIAQFANGDILIADSSPDGLNANQERGLFLIRMDKCGNELWAKTYSWAQNYLEFKDIDINAAGDIFIYGSAYELFDEYIFLLKLDKNGQFRKFRLFRAGTVDHFTYSIDLKNNRIMAYGLLLDWASQKQGFVALFDEELNFQEGKIFAPFASVGDAVFTKDDGFLCRSGPYLVKLDAQTNLQWAITLETDAGAFPSSGPLEVPGGYIFSYYHDYHAFFYKIDPDGKLLWKTDRFPAANAASDIGLLPDGNLIATYNGPGTGENHLCFIRLSPDGAVLEQQKLLIGQILHTGPISQAIGKKNTLHIVGSTDVNALSQGHTGGFLMQFSLNAPAGQCFQWEPLQDRAANDITLNINSLNLSFFNLDMTLKEAGVSSGVPDYSFEEQCDLSATGVIRKDTLLLCGENWPVVLPGPEFTWEDGFSGGARVLDYPGLYRASNNNCIMPVMYEYAVGKEACPCSVYLPNAFSPDDNGINDRLEFFSSCPVQQLHTEVYNRWGERVFEGDDPGEFWQGTFKQKPVQAGVYMVAVKYKLLNDIGGFQEGSVVQDVLLMR